MIMVSLLKLGKKWARFQSKVPVSLFDLSVKQKLQPDLIPKIHIQRSKTKGPGDSMLGLLLSSEAVLELGRENPLMSYFV